ncbi:hypothetical protein [Gordonia soli]|uniref:hypothetical protein n=1 Tax=Gordonia soli TaxID=320799 RepID=UPI001574F9AE|nr:hypothetical protein [Gordonia soli]
MARDGSTITTTLTVATFQKKAGDVIVVDRRGTTIDRIADRIMLDGQTVPLRTTVSDDGRKATFTPRFTKETRAALARGMHPVSGQKDRAFRDMLFHVANGLNRAGTVSTVAGAAVGAAVGGVVGLIAGCLIVTGCIWWGVVGLGIGAAAGAGIAGSIGTTYGDPLAGQAVLDWLRTPSLKPVDLFAPVPRPEQVRHTP